MFDFMKYFQKYNQFMLSLIDNKHFAGMMTGNIHCD